MNVVPVEDSPGIRQLLLQQVVAMRSAAVVAEARGEARSMGSGADVFRDRVIDMGAALAQLATWARHLHAQGECPRPHPGEDDRFPNPAPAVH